MVTHKNPVAVNPGLLPDDVFKAFRDERAQYSYMGKCPGCDLPFIEGKYDDGVCDIVEPWCLGWCEGCVTSVKKGK